MDDSRGFVKTETEVSSDNSALMRSIRRHENLLKDSLANISHATITISRGLGESIPSEGNIHVNFDNSIIQDANAEKDRDVKEVGVTMAAWKYRVKWYGKEGSIARAKTSEIDTNSAGSVGKEGVGLQEEHTARVRQRLTWAHGRACAERFRVW